MVRKSELERTILLVINGGIIFFALSFNHYIESKRRPRLISPDSVEIYRQIKGIKSNEEIASIVEGKKADKSN